MPSIKVVEIVSRVEAVLQDTGVRWPRLEFQSWLNEAYLRIVLRRPDANAKVGVFTCVAGTRQNLLTSFPTALKLLDITRNVAASSNKKVIRAVGRDVLDSQRPGWHNETAGVNIQQFSHDLKNPKEFYVYPPATTSAQLEVVYADTPSMHDMTETQLDPAKNDTTNIFLDDVYLSPLVDWVLYRAYLKDSESGANEARAAASLQAFMGALDEKTQVDMAVASATAGV